MSQENITVRARDLKFEDGAINFASSQQKEPYIDLYIAMARKRDLKPFLDGIAALPLKQRYTWRIVSALKSAFIDFDSHRIRVDMDTLSRGDRKKVGGLLTIRPVQFCRLLAAVSDVETMKKVMTSAIRECEERAAGRAKITPT